MGIESKTIVKAEARTIRSKDKIADQLIDAGTKLTNMGVEILRNGGDVPEYEGVQIMFNNGEIFFLTGVRS